jgi:hypothetical protein
MFALFIHESAGIVPRMTMMAHTAPAPRVSRAAALGLLLLLSRL